MNFRSISSLLALSCLVALVPSACGGDSNENGDSDGGSGDAGEGGTSGQGGSGGNKGGTSGQSGSAGKGGSSGKGGTTSTGGRGGDAGAGADGGLGGVGGEPGGAGEGGAGGEPGCTIASNATVPGTLRITADDNFRLYVNGTLIDEMARIWSSPQTYTVLVFRHPSQKNVIAVEGINTQEISTLDRMIVADLSFDTGTSLQSVVTDTTWKLSTASATNWFAVDFNDAAWGAAFDEGAHGITPYGNILGASSARLIWAYDSNVDAAAKPDPPEHVFARKSFYVNVAGTVTTAPGTCP
jgi:hypothetical protein